MVEFPFVVSAERKGCGADENLSQMARLADINFISSSPLQTGHPTQSLSGKLAYPPQPSMRGRMSLLAGLKLRQNGPTGRAATWLTESAPGRCPGAMSRLVSK